MEIDDLEFRRWWRLMHGDELTEIRLLSSQGTYSGYFYDCELALQCLHKHPYPAGVFGVLNSISKGCDGKSQRDKLIKLAKDQKATNGTDIEGRNWLMIDIDPVRKPDTNSNAEELVYAKEMMKRVGVYLRDQGFSSPIVAMSCNGYHMYYKVRIACTDETDELIRKFVKYISLMFSDDICSIDTSVFDRNRIAKAIGSKSNKGADTEDRPQRFSKFIKIPDSIVETDIAYIRKVAGYLPDDTPVKETRNTPARETFDLDAFIAKHGIRVANVTKSDKVYTKYVLEECPFCADHKAPDSALFKMDNGAVGFKCLHNHCQGYSWRDVRLMYEPDAYTKMDKDEFLNRRTYNEATYRQTPVAIKETEAIGKKWFSMSDIEWQDPSKFVYIPTGFYDLDKKIGGMALGDVTILSGRAGAGKTSLLNNIILNVIQRGYKVGVWSGELQASRFVSWLDQSAAGKPYVMQKAGYDDWFYCPKDIALRINSWLEGYLWLRNNDYKNHWTQLNEDIRECVERNGTQLVILDNLASMALDYDAMSQNEKQSAFIAELKEYAKKTNIHIVLVVHPRKEQMNALLRMESISGTFDLVNLVDNVLLAHRTGSDFERRGREFFGQDKVESLKMYNEVIEVAKNRSHGAVDHLVGLFFEKASRRFKNTFDEYVIYGWQESQDARKEPHYNQESKELPDDPLGKPMDSVPF